MDWLLLITLITACVVLIAKGMSRPGRTYEFPFWAGATFLGFVVPQFPALINDRLMPAEAVTGMLVFTTLCVAACGVGWAAGSKDPVGGIMRWELDEKRLVVLSAVLSLIGSIFYMKFNALPDEVRLMTQATGAPVMYLFFAKMLTFGFVVALLCFARRPSWTTFIIICYDAAFVLSRVVVTGKKGELAEFVLPIVLALWFQRRIAIPRWLALAGALFAALALNSTSDYRAITQEHGRPTLEQLSKIDILDNFVNVVENGAPEVRNAVERIHATNRKQSFDYGLRDINVLITQWVPAQLVGSKLKEALLLPLPLADRDYDPPVGSTETGMTDAFLSFWYLGFIKFLVIAYVLARIYRTACDGWAMAQVFYIVGASPSMHVITHGTPWLLSAWIQMGLLLLPGLLLARRWPRRVHSAQALALP